jgi:hypothetical protein
MLLVLVTCLVTACQSVDSQLVRQYEDATIVPTWVNAVPQDSGQFLYGIGEGKNRQAAIQNALTDLAAKLGITVSAQFNSTITVQKYGYELVKQDTQKIISTEIKAITINQYQVEKSYSPLPTLVYVLLKTDKHKLFVNYKQELDQQVRHYQVGRQQLRSAGVLQRYQHVHQEQQKLAVFFRKMLIAEVLNPQMDMHAYLQYEQQVIDDKRHLKQLIKFKVLANNSISHQLAAVLKVHLAQKQLLAINAASKFKLKVSVSESLSQAYDFYIGRYTVTVSVYESGKQVAGRQFYIKGQGTKNYQAAQRQAIKKFAKIFNTQTLWQVLGLSTQI